MNFIKRFLLPCVLTVFSFCCFAKERLPHFKTLDGTWDFYYQKSPSQVYMQLAEKLKADSKETVPGFWNKTVERLEGSSNPRTYGSYHYRLETLDPDTTYALLIKDAPQSACAIFVNGNKICQNGDPYKALTGDDVLSKDCIVKPMYGEFKSDKYGKADIVIFISNYIYRKSGLSDSVLFGTAENIFEVNTIVLCFYTIVYGIFLFIGLLNILQFFINKAKKEYLYLGIIALAFALRIVTAGYCSFGILYPWFTAAVKIKCEYLALWVVPLFLLETLAYLYPTNGRKHLGFITEKMLRTILSFSLYFIGLTSILLPAHYSNQLVPILQILEYATTAYIISLCIYNIINRKKYVWYFFTGIIFLTVGSFIDMLYTKERTLLPISLFPFFLVIFIFIMIAMLAKIQNDIYKDTVKISKDLKKLNEAYLRFVPQEFLNLLNKDDITKIELGNYANIKMPIMFSKTIIRGNLTPEATFSLFNEYLEEISPVIKRHCGFVSKFLSGGFMALFTHKSIEAVECAFDIIECNNRLNEKYKEKGLSVSTKISLHYGKMIIGTIGEEHRLDDTVISDTVNTVARIESVCERLSKDFIISAELKEMCDAESPDSEIEFVPLNSIAVKGKKMPLQLFECVKKEV